MAVELTRKPLRITSTSDIHLGNNRVSTYSICESLQKFLIPKLDETDVLVIGGDVTDTALGLGDSSTTLLIDLFIEIFFICEEKNITIVVLRGTISHDRDHLRTLVALHSKYRFKNKLYYSEKLDVEEIPELGIKVLYLPDNLPYESSDEAIALAKRKISERGWDGVDYVFAHGYFKHVLPEGLPREPHCTFRAEQFDFVKTGILVGHVHTSSVLYHTFDDGHSIFIIYNGSLARLCHGEEEDKGFIYLTEQKSGDVKIEFVKNSYAMPFLTYDLSRHLSSEEAVKAYRDKILSLKKEITHHIRVIHPSPEVKTALSRYTAANFPNIRFTAVKPRKSKDSKEASATNPSELETIDLKPPTEEGLPEMVSEFLTMRGTPIPMETITHHLQRL